MARRKKTHTAKTTVRTTELGRAETLGSTQNKLARRPNAPGYVTGIVTGILGKWYLVVHEGETIPAIYNPEELTLEPNAYWRVQHVLSGQTYFKEWATYLEVEEHLEEISTAGGVSIMVEGPFYSAKELEEGLIPSKSLFDHLEDE